MADQDGLALAEYQIAKESIRAVMAQLSTITVALLALSVTILQFGVGEIPREFEVLPWYMTLLLINFLAAYIVYQNIQIGALQRHIAYLESRLGAPDIFCWESVIARVWYEGNDFRSKALNILIMIPPLAILVVIYFGMGMSIGVQSPWFIVPLAVNLAYVIALGLAFSFVSKAVKNTRRPLPRDP
jgi:hypothetical protein